MSENIINIKNLTKTFFSQNKEHIALSNINLSIKKGSIFGVIGLSGAGKSTLVRCMNFLEKPTSGKVYFEDKCLNDMSDREIRNVRKQMAMIFQNFNLLEQRTVLKNVLFPLEIINVNKSEAIKKATELLDLVDLGDKLNSFPSQLSGGQKQRVAIARALALNPKVILCDEATSALDPKTTTQILNLLKKINKELSVTIIIITHEMKVVESICDEVAIIDNSKIVEIGSVKDIFTSPKSEIGKKLIFGKAKTNKLDSLDFDNGKRKLRIVFEGNKVNEPIIANIILKNQLNLSVLYANVKEVGDSTYGQLIVEFPNDIENIDEKINNVFEYLTSLNIKFEEILRDDR